MKKEEMQNLVDKIAQERKAHLENIENLTLKQIKQIQRKSYLPKRKTKDELELEARSHVKSSWKDSGIGGDLFNKPPIMRPKLLDPWTMSRVSAPAKASTKFFFTDQQPWTYAGAVGGEFKVDPDFMKDKTLPKQMREVLDARHKKYIEWCERPSKFVPEPTEPACFAREIRFFKNDKTSNEFGYNTHTAWENFQNTVRSKSY